MVLASLPLVLSAWRDLWDIGVHEHYYSSVMGMTVPYEHTGRTRQKARTRAAMVDATRELLAEGMAPTVEQAAPPPIGTSPTSARS